MQSNYQGRRWLPAFAYAAGVAAVIVMVGSSALVQSRTPLDDPSACDVLPVIRVVDMVDGNTPERLKITVVGKRSPELARARQAVARAAGQPG
jgi:hypothetical protein